MAFTRSGSLLAITLGLGIAGAAPVAAEMNTEAVRIAQAGVVPTSSIQQQTLYLSPDRAYSYNLETERAVTVNGLNIPAGAEIQGQYEPASGGLRYVANSVMINGRAYSLNANSQVLNDVKDPRDTRTGSIAEDAGIGAAGGLILGEILGDSGIAGAVGGAAAGAAVGNVTADRVVVVEPEEMINLYL
ncbi:hypothetical protein C7271_16135 [filamentous cyanobacterium CCP5]|nr:hypothetical protein C7271_16135 [filamentous cyanobacterium CCP5]